MSDNGNVIDKKQVTNDVHTTTTEFRTLNDSLNRYKEALKKAESKLDAHRNELKRLRRAVRDAEEDLNNAKDDDKERLEDALDNAREDLKRYREDNNIDQIESEISEVKASLEIMKTRVEESIRLLRAVYGPAIDQAIGKVYNEQVKKNLDSKFRDDLANVHDRKEKLSKRRDNKDTLESILGDISDELKNALTHMHNYRNETDAIKKDQHKKDVKNALQALNRKISSKLGIENTFKITEEDLEFMIAANCFNPTDKSLRSDFMKKYSEHIASEENKAQRDYNILRRKYEKYGAKQEDVIAKLSNGPAAPGPAAPTVDQLTEQLNNLQGFHPIKSMQLKKAIFEAQPIEQLTEQLNNLQGWHPFKRRKLENAIKKAAMSLPEPRITTPAQTQTPTEKDKFIASLRSLNEIADYEVKRYFDMQEQQNQQNQQNQQTQQNPQGSDQGR